MNTLNNPVLSAESIGPIEEFETWVGSIRQDIINWLSNNSTMLITIAVVSTVLLISIAIIISVITNRIHERELDRWYITEQYWRDKRNSRLLPRGYFSTMRKATDGRDKKSG